MASPNTQRARIDDHSIYFLNVGMTHSTSVGCYELGMSNKVLSM